MNKKIAFVGGGNMATAIIGGLIGSGLVPAENIAVADISDAAREKLQKNFGVATYQQNAKAVEGADIVVLAIKPIYLAEAVADFGNTLPGGTIVISIVAGQSIQKLQGMFKNPVKIARVMPNTPALVGEAMSALTPADNMDQQDTQLVLQLLGSIGKAEVVPERLMDAVTGVSGSSPAYVFMFIEALADSVVEAGMPRAQAYTFAAQAVMGSAKMVLQLGEHPAALKDMVCSPGGTTSVAVRTLDERGMRAAVMDAVKACIEKQQQL